MRRCEPSRLAVAGNQRQTFVRTDIMATKAPIKATFSPDAGLLSVFGDDGDNVIVTSRDAAGQILGNGGAVPVSGGTATVANTATIQVFGNGGHDTISLDGSNGALPPPQLCGGAGNDGLTRRSVADRLVRGGRDSLPLDGGAGNDTIPGGDGNDTLLGGDGNDVIAGGRGNDTAQLGAGDDTFVWNPGDGSDVVEGQDGTDTLVFNGANVDETMDIAATDSRTPFTRDTRTPTSDLNSIDAI